MNKNSKFDQLALFVKIIFASVEFHLQVILSIFLGIIYLLHCLCTGSGSMEEEELLLMEDLWEGASGSIDKKTPLFSVKGLRTVEGMNCALSNINNIGLAAIVRFYQP